MRDRLMPGEILKEGEKLVSENSEYTFIVQDDGNVVLYDRNNKPLWASNTQNVAVKELIMQDDGNLVLYRHDNVAAWASGTNGKPGSSMIVQDDGNVVLYHPNAVWATNTCQ